MFFLFFSFIFISWRLITSQRCSGFCHTLTCISHGVTPHGLFVPFLVSFVKIGQSNGCGHLSFTVNSLSLRIPTWGGQLCGLSGFPALACVTGCASCYWSPDLPPFLQCSHSLTAVCSNFSRSFPLANGSYFAQEVLPP